MRILRAYRNAWRFAHFDPATGRLTEVPFWKAFGHRHRSSDGWFDRLGDEIIILYRQDGFSRIRAGTVDFPFDENLVIRLTPAGQKEQLVIESAQKHVVVLYPRPRAWEIESDLTPFVEPEHFDFGLFILHLSKDSERRARIAHIGEFLP